MFSVYNEDILYPHMSAFDMIVIIIFCLNSIEYRWLDRLDIYVHTYFATTYPSDVSQAYMFMCSKPNVY